MYKWNNSKFCCVTVLLLLALSVTGCVRTGIRVVPVPSTQVLTLEPEDITEIMRMAGFTDAQIADLGVEVWQGLARAGMVQIQIRGRVEVIFTVSSKTEVTITSLTRGYHVYNTQTGSETSSSKQPAPKPGNQESNPIEQDLNSIEQDSTIIEN